MVFYGIRGDSPLWICGTEGHLYKYQAGTYSPKTFDSIVQNLAYNPLLAAIFALFSIILNKYLLSLYQ